MRDLHLWDIVKQRVRPLALGKGPHNHRREPDVFCETLDLHGLNLEQAHGRSNDFLAMAHRLGVPSVLVITGKSGQIAREFTVWAELTGLVRRVEPENGGGAFRVHLRRGPK